MVYWLRIMAAVAEGVKLNWNLSTEDILKRTDELIERSRKVYNAVGALKPEELAYENCLKVKTCLPTALSIQFFISSRCARTVHVLQSLLIL